MEGWSDIFFMTSDSSSYLGIFFYIAIIIIGNWFVLQLIVAVISNNLMDEIDDEEKSRNEIKEVAKQIMCKTNDNEIELSEEKKKEVSINIQHDKNIKQDKEKKNIISNVIYSIINCKIMLKLRRSKFVNDIQKILNSIMNNDIWDVIMLLIIIVDTVSTCLITKDTPTETRMTISKISNVCTIIFAVEMVCKLIMLNPSGYVNQTIFNLLDGIFTILSILDQFVIPSEQGFFIFRILRSLRVLRVSKYSSQFQRLFEVFKDSSLHLLSLIIIWFMSVLIFATFGFQLFSGTMNFEDGVPDENFDSIGNSILSIIQLFTMENWNNIEISVVHAKGIGYVLIPIIICKLFIYSLKLVIVINFI